MPSITIGCSGFGMPGLVGSVAGEEPVRAAVLLKIGDLVVGQLDVVLALPRLQRVPLRKPVDDDVCLHSRTS